ncbi:hypothetical protein RQN30_00930 [Arcanobacterium hippocoleae]
MQNIITRQESSCNHIRVWFFFQQYSSALAPGLQESSTLKVIRPLPFGPADYCVEIERTFLDADYETNEAEQHAEMIWSILLGLTPYGCSTSPEQVESRRIALPDSESVNLDILADALRVAANRHPDLAVLAMSAIVSSPKLEQANG